jgi:hypothetical protein
MNYSGWKMIANLWACGHPRGQNWHRIGKYAMLQKKKKCYAGSTHDYHVYF